MKQLRLEALADGIFAIVLTILVFEIRLPVLVQPISNTSLIVATVSLMPLFLSYLLSFSLLFTYWRAHHFIASVYAKNIDTTFTNINAVFFFFVGLVPFSSHFLGLYSSYSASVVIFSLNVICIGLALLWMRTYAAKSPTIENAEVTRIEERHSYIRILFPVLAAIGAIVISPFNTTLALTFLTLGILFNLLRSSTHQVDTIFGLKYDDALTSDTKEKLKLNTNTLVAPPRGILAADESSKTCCARFEKHSLECTEESRRAYRELLIATPGTEEFLTGIIMVDETLRQRDSSGKLFTHILRKKGIQSGIKVDEGLLDVGTSGEQTTKGIEGLPPRLKEYATLGATFAKWRAAFLIGEKTPSVEVIEKNCALMAEYAHLCQQNGIVPIVEPEVLMDGDHSAEVTEHVIGQILPILFNEIRKKNIYIPGLVLKTAMCVTGKDAGPKASPKEVAERTIRVLKKCVPSDIGGVVFLSGGQSPDESNDNYDAIMQHAKEERFPMTFSFSRAIQSPVLDAWAKNQVPATVEPIYLEQLRKIFLP